MPKHAGHKPAKGPPGRAPMHRMPDGTMMPGASHGGGKPAKKKK